MPGIQLWEIGPGSVPRILENIRRPFEIRLVNREGEVVAREFTVVLLKHDYPGGAPGSKEQPLSPLVPKANR